ncbi:ABC transporter permease [Pusillimonas sp. CC-YST705]|uniref:ABC transporter permease n=1 Tax=Mesopusillimonas faecipullorum TaxID=2755040 RepID=A0ABS8CEN0_9BURK|nr:ABC transporter permease [Mesopusillimonas faecipullorum]MCB5364029.1 ABC transporter permease [Mesopusillimonas faecipullorum]
MITYICRRLAYGVLVLLGVNILTFLLFFTVNTPDDMARMAIGGQRISQEAVERWKLERGYDKPLFFNTQAAGGDKLTDTIFYERSLPLLRLDFGLSDAGHDISHEIRQRMGPSLALALPTFILGLGVCIAFAFWLVFFRYTAIDFAGVVMCVVLLSISGLFYIIAGQWLFAKVLRWVPYSGFGEAWWDSLRFLALPVLVAIISRLGGEARFYRTLFLEEINKEYVRTARAKGLAERVVMFRHVLRNAMLPILTGSVSAIPLLFMGSLIAESFFGIPGLGSYTIDAINAQDFSIVRAMVFLGSALYIVGLILADVSYTLADPRVRFE